MSHPLGAGLSLSVGIIATGLAILAYMAYQRSQDKRILFVASAFGLFAIKGILQFVDWRTNFMGHNAMEIVATSMDFGVVLLLVAPFLKK